MHRLFLIGLNHTTAPLELREKLAFANSQQQRDALAEFQNRFGKCEIVLLSTCNRVELYLSREVHGHPREEEVIDFLASARRMPAEMFKGHLYRKTDRAVVEHLYSVACSLDSMVLGETQILGQVREAYELSVQSQATGSMLNPLFQRGISVGKEVMRETGLSEGRLSVASVAVEYAKKIFDHFGDKTVLSIGAGKMAKLVLQSFKSLAPRRLMICNRDFAKAQSLALGMGGESVPFENLTDHLAQADIVLTSTGSTDPIITRKQFGQILRKRRQRRIFLIDIALPRDIEPSVGELENVYLYNLDDLQHVVSQTRAQRTDQIQSARAIVHQHVEEFVLWHRQRELGPAIDRLYQKYHALAQEELQKTLASQPDITPEERQRLEEATRRTVNKLLHDPIQTLRNSDALHGPTAQYLHAMEKLFHLNEDVAKKKENE